MVHFKNQIELVLVPYEENKYPGEITNAIRVHSKILIIYEKGAI